MTLKADKTFLTSQSGLDPAKESFFWVLTALVLGIVSFLKGLRLPSRWAASEALVNYDHGLIKRGLFGATLGRWLHLERYARFSVASYIFLFIFLALLVLLTQWSKVLDCLGNGEVVAIFSASFAVTYLSHLVGYPDILLGILTLGLLLIRGVRARLAATVPVTICALLLHESYLLTFFPVLLFSFLLDALEIPETSKRMLVLIIAAPLVLIAVAATIRLAYQRPMSVPQVAQMMSELSARADFVLRPDYFEVFTLSSMDNVKLVAQHYLSGDRFYLVFLQAFIAFILPMILLLVAIVRMVRVKFQGATRRVTTAAAVCTACSPLLLNVIGWDSARWNALSCVNEFLILLLLCRGEAKRVLLPPLYSQAAILCVALSMATGESLMDHIQVNPFPFVDSALSLAHSVVSHRLWTPPVR